jgi:hypothetical protein
MQWSDTPFQPAPRTLRQFAGLWLVFFGGLGGWLAVGRAQLTAGCLLAGLALVVGCLGLAKPLALRWVFVAWMLLAFPIGWAVSRVLLAATFYGVFTPAGLVFRLLSRDVLARKRDPKQSSYWAAKSTPADVRGYFRPF